MQESPRELLNGGDRRSQAQSHLVLARARGNAARIAQLAALCADEDWLVAMRSIDLLEKLARENATWVEPHREIFLGELADSDKWEIRLHVVRGLPLFRWTRIQRRRAVAILSRDIDHLQSFVRAWALDGLATFAQQGRALMPAVERALVAFEQSGRKSLEARARHIRERLKRAKKDVGFIYFRTLE